jgi:uncharacterized membrane protein
MWHFENIEEKAEQASREGFNIELGTTISEAWNIFKQYALGFIGFTLFYIATGLIPEFLLGNDTQMKIIKQLISLFFIPLSLGYAIVTYKIINKEAYSFGDFFSGYAKLMPLIIVFILYMLMVITGLILLIIPGIYLGIVFSFCFYVMYFGKKSIVDSFKISRKFIHRNFWEYLIFMIVIMIFIILGILALGIGILFTFPVGFIAIALYFYKGLASTNNEESVENHLI